MNRFFVLLLVVLPAFSWGNEQPQSKEIWEFFLPNKLRSALYVQNECSKIERYGRLNPDLIYVYLEHLQRRFATTTTRDSSFEQYFSFLYNKSKKEKSKWAHRMLRVLDEKEIFFPLTSFRLKHLFAELGMLEFSIDIPDSLPLPPDYDFNRAACFKYLFLTKKSESYDPEKNYREKFEYELSKIGKLFEKYYSEVTLYGKKQRKALREKAFVYSYIFADSYLPGYERVPFTLADFIYKTVASDFTNHSAVYFSYTYFSSDITYDKVIQFKDLFTVTYSADVKARHNYFVWLGIRYAFRERLLPFSSVNAKVGIGVQSKALNINDRVVGHVIRYDGDLYVNGTYYIGKIRNLKMDAFAAQVTVPFFYLTNDLFFEAGAFYAYYRLKFDYDYWFDGYIIDHSTNGVPEFYSGWSRSVKAHTQRFKGVLSANYRLFDYFLIHINFLIYNDFHGGISFCYQF